MAEMVQLINEIVSGVGAEIRAAKVADYDSVTKLVTPLVAIKEVPSSVGAMMVSADGSEQPYVVRNDYTVEFYAKQKKNGDTYITSAQAAKSLYIEVDKILNQTFGLTMSGAASIAPYPADVTVTRIVARYYGYIDTRNNTILRRV